MTSHGSKNECSCSLMVVTGSSVVRCNTPDEQALSAWSGKHALLYSYSTHIGKRKRMKATHPRAVLVCASSANYMTVSYQFLNEAVCIWKQHIPGWTPIRYMELLSRNCTILQISQCAFAGLIQSSSQSFQGCQPKTECRQIIPTAFNHCNIRLCFFPQILYIKSWVPKKHHETSARSFD